jgi:hypothetical protein
LLGFERVPRKQQRQLEQWVGRAGGPASAAASGSADLPEHTNQYLFSTVGGQSQFGVVVVRRWLLLLSASLVTLTFGLLLIYFPAVRRPRTLFVAAAVLLLAAMIYPELTLLLAQAASVGFVLALTALALRQLVGRQKPTTVATQSKSGFRLERSSTRSAYHPPEDVEPETTAAVSIAADASDDEANP